MADPDPIAKLRRLLGTLIDNDFHPLAYEQCGEKSSSIVIGSALDKNNEPISGRCPNEYQGDDGVWIDTVAERSPFLESSESEGMIRAVVAAVNALPVLLDIAEAAQRHMDAVGVVNVAQTADELDTALARLEGLKPWPRHRSPRRRPCDLAAVA